MRGHIDKPWFFRSILTTWCSLALAGTVVLYAQDPAPKGPIPSQTAQARAKALILEIFKEDLAQAREPAAKSKLAAYFLQQGRESKDEPANRFVLFQGARGLAVHAGDATLALLAVEELARAFEVNVFEMKVATLASMGAHTQSTEANKALVDLILPLMAEAVDADDYESALMLAQVADDAAQKSQIVSLVNAVRKRHQEVQAAQKGFAPLKPFVDQLKKEPRNAQANYELGKYFGLLKGKWDRALPLLAMGSDETLKSLARKDLAKPQEGKDQLALADAWWDRAEKEKEPARLNLHFRAKHWYEKAVLNLSGLNRTKAVRRSERIAARLEGLPQEGPFFPVGEIRQLQGHTEEIKCLAFSPDGQRAASGGMDQTVRIWNLHTGKEEKALRGHSKQVWNVAFHPSLPQLFSSSWDSTARLWDLRTGMEIKRFPHPVDVNGLAVSRDGNWLLVGCDNRHPYLWRVSSGEEVRKFNGFASYVYGVAFSPDGRHVAAGSADKTLRLFDLASGAPVRTMEGQTSSVQTIAFSPDGRFIFSGGDGAAHQWEVASGKEVRRFEGSSGLVAALAVTPDGRRLLTSGDDRLVRLWDVASGKVLHVFKGHSETVHALAISPNGRLALSAGLDRTIRLWGLPR